MKYLAFILRIEIMAIGLIMMIMNPVIATPPFMSWAAILTIWIYFTLLGCYGEDFSMSVFKKESKRVIKKKSFFRK